MSTFPGRVGLYSNSAGLAKYDPDGHEADALETALGIPVIRHVEKKPGGSVGELEDLFGCPAERMVFIGDRYLTDVAFGNRNGMLTVRSEPWTAVGEKSTVRMARRIEEALVARRVRKGRSAPPHRLAPNPSLFVKKL